MYIENSASLALYAPGEFGKDCSKTAESALRYGINPIFCVINESSACNSIKSVTRVDVNALNQPAAKKRSKQAAAYRPS